MPPKPPGTRHVPREEPEKPFWAKQPTPTTTLAPSLDERVAALEEDVRNLEEAMQRVWKLLP